MCSPCGSLCGILRGGGCYRGGAAKRKGGCHRRSENAVIDQRGGGLTGCSALPVPALGVERSVRADAGPVPVRPAPRARRAGHGAHRVASGVATDATALRGGGVRNVPHAPTRVRGGARRQRLGRTHAAIRCLRLKEGERIADFHRERCLQIRRALALDGASRARTEAEDPSVGGIRSQSVADSMQEEACVSEFGIAQCGPFTHRWDTGCGCGCECGVCVCLCGWVGLLGCPPASLLARGSNPAGATGHHC